MFVLSRSTQRLLAVGSTTALLVVPWAPALAGNGNSNSNDKQTICHATHSDTNPYVVITPNKNGDVSGHAKHTGPVWTPALKALHVHWGDIIPPFDDNDHGAARHYAGLNWDANGQAWFANGCRVPITGEVNKTNNANGDSTFSGDETATAEGADVPFTVVVTNTSIVPVLVSSLLDTVGGTAVTFTPTPDPVGVLLAAGASTSFTFRVPGYSPPDGGAKVNLMTVGLARSGDPGNHTVVEDGSTVRTTVPPPPAPDVSIVKAGTATAAPGDDLTWTLTARNDGSVPASDVTVTDVLPTGTTLVSVGGAGWTCGGITDLSCTLDADLGVGQTAVVTVVATLSAGFTGTTISNTALVTPDDATPTDNSSTATTEVTQATGGGGGITGGGGSFTGGGGFPTTLPRTGGPTELMAASALAMLLAGIMLVLLTPRRRARG